MKHNFCPTCNTKALYDSRFDAFLCAKCNAWLERECLDHDCQMCKDRPLKPGDLYLGKARTFSTIIGDAVSLDHFNQLVEQGSISPDDGCVSSIFVDGIDQVELAITNWSSDWGHPITRAMTKWVKLDELAKMFPGKPIHIEWCNK